MKKTRSVPDKDAIGYFLKIQSHEELSATLMVSYGCEGGTHNSSSILSFSCLALIVHVCFNHFFNYLICKTHFKRTQS